MALTVGTNSYISEVDASSYLTLNGLSPLSSAETLLKRATKALDMLYGHRFIGQKQTITQPLLWPRYPTSNSSYNTPDGYYFLDADGNPRNFEIIPTEVADATVELAVLLDSEVDIYAQPDPFVVKSTVKIDVIEQTVDYGSRPYRAEPLSKVNLILRPLLNSAGSLRLVR